VRGAKIGPITGRQSNATAHIPCDADAFDQLVDAARDQSRVSGLTHNFYRYPARFSPKFVRSVIEQFTKPGDLVLDPFMGGGTTMVEALALGRRGIGTDISSLATFVSQAKTLVLSDGEFRQIERWTTKLDEKINIHSPSTASQRYADAGYHRHLSSALTWRLRKAVEQVLATVVRLPSTRLETFARCVVLRTAQWALDGRKQLPSVDQFRRTIQVHAKEMLEGARQLRTAVESYANFAPMATCIHRSVIGLDEQNPCGETMPKLVLTSPPYPGVHVLYHRWQVDGRKETSAPFWIANRLDGSGAAYYTLGDRHAAGNWTYFEGLTAALTSVARLCDEETTIVQVVAFSNPKRQLPRYLEVAEAAGFAEASRPHVSGEADGRLWRTIPNRKWHAGQLGDIPASREVVLFHRRQSSTSPPTVVTSE
jgi:hypothetical protein